MNEVPYHNLAVAGARSEVRRTVDHIKSVDLGLVTCEGVHKSHVEVVPDFDCLVPRGSDTDSGFSSVIELDAGDGVSVLVLVNGVLAL